MDLGTLTDLSEQIADAYASEQGVRRYATWHLMRLQDEAADVADAWVELSGERGFPTADERKSTFASDLTDVLVELLVLARSYDIDLAEQIEQRAHDWAAIGRSDLPAVAAG